MKKKTQQIVNTPASFARWISEFATYLMEVKKMEIGALLLFPNFIFFPVGCIYHACLGKYALPQNNEFYTDDGI